MSTSLNILHINSSILGEQSHSRSLAEQLLSQLQQALKTGQQPNIVERDLAKTPVPHLDGERLTALFSDKQQRTATQQTIVDEADQLLEEVRQADILVIGLPMYNFGVPSQFKAWLDHLARAGITFRYTEQGPQGLLENKPVYVLASRGGFYANTDQDQQTPFIRQFFSMLGLTDVRFIFAEGLNISPEQQSESLRKAGEQIQSVTPQVATS